MEVIRTATPEEIEALKATSDLQFAQQVFAYKTARAIFRLAPELDPVIFGDLSNNEKRAFLYGLETHMRLSGIQAYYFQVSADEENAHYRSVVENWGAVPTNGPEIRYKKPL